MAELNSHLKREGNSSFSNSTTCAVVHHQQVGQQGDKMYSFFNHGTSDFMWRSLTDFNSVCN